MQLMGVDEVIWASCGAAGTSTSCGAVAFHGERRLFLDISLDSHDVLVSLRGCDVCPGFSIPSPSKPVQAISQEEELESIKDLSPLIDELSELNVCGGRRVRFSDEVGEDLATVHVLDCESIPTVPQSVLDRHREKVDRVSMAAAATATWSVAFDQPASDWRRLADTFARHKIALENAVTVDGNRLLCTLKLDASFPAEKTQVFARYTSNNWRSFEDIQGVCLKAGVSFHAYSIQVVLPADARPGDLAFIALYSKTTTDGGRVVEHWDSNEGRNYQFFVPLPTSPALPEQKEATRFKVVSSKKKSVSDSPYW